MDDLIFVLLWITFSSSVARRFVSEEALLLQYNQCIFGDDPSDITKLVSTYLANLTYSHNYAYDFGTCHLKCHTTLECKAFAHTENDKMCHTFEEKQTSEQEEIEEDKPARVMVEFEGSVFESRNGMFHFIKKIYHYKKLLIYYCINEWRPPPAPVWKWRPPPPPKKKKEEKNILKFFLHFIFFSLNNIFPFRCVWISLTVSNTLMIGFSDYARGLYSRLGSSENWPILRIISHKLQSNQLQSN